MSLAFNSLDLVHPNGHRALKSVNFTVTAGERIAIIGPSGAGKTSLLRVAAAALKPTHGRVESLATDPWKLAPRELKRLRARIGVIHQSPPIPPRLRVVTAVLSGRLGTWSTGRALLSLAYPSDIDGARRVLAQLDLADRLFDRCDRLSGGELQRVGIARTLYQQPDLMLADEPVSALDPSLSDIAIGQLVAQATGQGATLVASLHAVDLALKWFPRVVGLRAGEVMFDRPADQVSAAMLNELYANEGATLPLQGGALSSPVAPVPQANGNLLPLIRPNRPSRR